MFKKIRVKIILGIIVFAILLIATMNIVNIQLVKSSNISQEIIADICNNIKLVTIVSLVILLVAILVLIKILSKYVIYPVDKLIKSGEKINNSNKEDMIDMMTSELENKLSEVSSQKNQIETILLHMTDGIIAFNRQGEIILINPAAKQLLSIGPEDNTFDDIFQKFKLDINMEKIIYLENWTSTEQRIEVEDNFVNVYFAPFKDELDRPDGVIAVVQDITEHVKLDNMQKEFVADVSHELKTPITSIMGYADTLLEGDYDKETQEKFLNVIASESRRMARLVTDLLTLSRYDNNKNKTKKVQFDLGDLVKKCQEKLAIEIKKKNHDVKCFCNSRCASCICR